MHETHLFKNIFKYLEGEELHASRRIKKLCISVSEFGGMTWEDFMEHYKELAAGTRWESVDIELKSVPYGPEVEIEKIYFE
jgi:Zn finger protein HypA/HybF involved in hydrogenase expression